MATSDDYLKLYMESLAAEGLDRESLCTMEADLLTRVGRLRIRRDRHLRDIEVARLLPLGADVIRARFGGCRATAYNRAHRGIKLSKSCDGS